MDIWLIWLIIAAILILVEILTFMVASFCLAVGCVFAMAASLIGCNFEWQLGSLIIGSVVAFIIFAPIMRRRHKKQNPAQYGSNMEALIGRETVITEDIPIGGIGRLRIDGDNWQARNIDGIESRKGDRVRIVGYDSIILIVELVSL